jgi:hypothetical protein
MLTSRIRPSQVTGREHTRGRLPRSLCVAALIAVVAAYYLVLLSNGTMQVFAPELLDKIYDSMLLHLMHGEFDVDPKAIDFETTVINGKTYTYFGVFPALLRLLALPFTDLSRAHLARLSCLAATVIFVALQLRTLVVVHASLPAASRKTAYLGVMVAATVLSGPQIYLLAFAEVYDEALLWAGVMAAAFNLVVLRAALGAGLRTSDLAWLAVFAGLAFNTRSSIGIGLYIATFLLVMCAAGRWHSERLSAVPARSVAASIGEVVGNPGLVLPLVILGVLAVALGIVNFGRWGNPFAFAGPAHNYYLLQRDPKALRMFDTYGAFNLSRVWISALYYATGIPWLLKSVPPFAEFLQARYFRIEAPPLTPLLTNPLTIILAGIGLYRLSWKPGMRGDAVAILRLTLIGHAIIILILFAFLALTLRYRFDLAPFMTLAAFVGYRSFCIAAAETSEKSQKSLFTAAVGLCLVGILFSHYVLVLHKAWSMGVPDDVRMSLRPFLPSTYLPVPGPFE